MDKNVRTKETLLKNSPNGYQIYKVELFNDIGRIHHWYEVIDKETGAVACASSMYRNAISWARTH